MGRENISVSNFDVFVADFPDTYKLMKQDKVSKTYSFPESYVSYRKPRAVSAGQRERARERMQGIDSNDTQWMKIV